MYIGFINYVLLYDVYKSIDIVNKLYNFGGMPFGGNDMHLDLFEFCIHNWPIDSFVFYGNVVQ